MLLTMLRCSVVRRLRELNNGLLLARNQSMARQRQDIESMLIVD